MRRIESSIPRKRALGDENTDTRRVRGNGFRDGLFSLRERERDRLRVESEASVKEFVDETKSTKCERHGDGMLVSRSAAIRSSSSDLEAFSSNSSPFRSPLSGTGELSLDWSGQPSLNLFQRSTPHPDKEETRRTAQSYALRNTSRRWTTRNANCVAGIPVRNPDSVPPRQPTIIRSISARATKGARNGVEHARWRANLKRPA